MADTGQTVAFDDRTGRALSAEGVLPVRVVRNARPVSLVVGGGLVVAGGLAIWLAAAISAGPDAGRNVLFTFVVAISAVIQGVILLSWNRWGLSRWR